MKKVRWLFLTAIVFSLSACQTNALPNMDDATPSHSAASPEWFEVGFRDMKITLQLLGVSETSQQVGLQSPKNSLIELNVAIGSKLSRGQVIGTFGPDAGQVGVYSELASSGTIAESKLDHLKKIGGDLVSPVSGRLRSTAHSYFVESKGLDAVVTLTPLQALRMESVKFLGTVNLDTIFGPETVSCEALWLERTTESSGNVLHCRIPDDVETVAGLPIVLKLESETLKDVIAIPAKYVGVTEDKQSYAVQVVNANSTIIRKVKVGITDGVLRVITFGLLGAEKLLPFDDEL
jgi:hypothetical protein